MMRLGIRAARIFDGERFLDNHTVCIEGERVVDVAPSAHCAADPDSRTLVDGILAPGFIDIQVNGGGDVLFTNAPGKDSLAVISASHRASGTTGMLPTLISDCDETLKTGVEAAVEAEAAGNCGILGVHLEGPFLDSSKRGAHSEAMIRKLTSKDVDWLCSLDARSVIVTLAPEHVQPGQIRQLCASGIHVFAGHSDASYEQVKHAIGEGLKGFTHLYNAMSQLSARAPGVVGAALDFDDTWAGIIADGHHVDPAAIRIAHKAKPRGKLILVTDAMPPVGGKKSFFEINNERVYRRDGKLVNASGALAGSAIGMIDAVRIATHSAGIPLRESLRMAALYPAELLGLDKRLGRIARGYRADFVHFDQHFKVLGTWVAGQYQAHGT